MTSTGTSIASYLIYWHYRHHAAHLTQSIYNALIHTQREEKAHKPSSLNARLSSRHYLRVKAQQTSMNQLIIACNMSPANQEKQMMKTMTKPQNYATMETYYTWMLNYHQHHCWHRSPPLKGHKPARVHARRQLYSPVSTHIINVIFITTIPILPCVMQIINHAASTMCLYLSVCCM